MKESSLEYLVCPSCHARFDLTIRSADGGEVMDAELQCTGCALRYPVRSGVPRFIRTDGPGPPNSTAAAFGWEWRAFSRIDEHHERQFLDWIAPADRGIFRDRVVVEGGCGKGRHTRLAARWGARAVIGVDLSDAVDVAFENTRCEKNVHIVQADLLRLPLRPGSCDYAFSVGVLHHLEDPGSGFKSLFRVVRPHGAMSIWVYGAENNAWVVRLVSPLRRGVTARLPPRGLYLLSGAMAVPLWAVLRGVYAPTRRFGPEWLKRGLFYYPYLSYISEFPFREIHHIVHDHLAAPVAHYLRREEVERWYREVGARDAVIAWHNRNSWRGYGVAPAVRTH